MRRPCQVPRRSNRRPGVCRTVRPSISRSRLRPSIRQAARAAVALLRLCRPASAARTHRWACRFQNGLTTVTIRCTGRAAKSTLSLVWTDHQASARKCSRRIGSSWLASNRPHIPESLQGRDQVVQTAVMVGVIKLEVGDQSKACLEFHQSHPIVRFRHQQSSLAGMAVAADAGRSRRSRPGLHRPDAAGW